MPTKIPITQTWTESAYWLYYAWAVCVVLNTFGNSRVIPTRRLRDWFSTIYLSISIEIVTKTNQSRSTSLEWFILENKRLSTALLRKMCTVVNRK